MESAILVGTHALDELRELATSAGARIIDEVIQHRDRPDPATFIGKGKLEELHEEVVVEGVDVVIFDDELSPGQAKNLEEALDTKVVDRTALILDIFARRARSKEGKLQVELAQLEYRLPRLSLASRRRNRHTGSRRDKAGNGPPPNPPPDQHAQERNRADSKTPAIAPGTPPPRAPSPSFAGRLHKCRQIDPISIFVQGKHACLETPVLDSGHVDPPNSAWTKFSDFDF